MLTLKNITKIYSGKDNNDVKALRGVSITFPQTGMVFLLGKSGSGKSTLLNIIGGLDRFNSGEILICGKSSESFSRADFDSYRNTFIGFIFQEYNLLDEMTVGENIALALSLQGRESDKEAVDNILKTVDLEGMADRKPNTLSGGQKQRIAIARALIKEPKIIMADEPTGALDSINGKQIFDLLKELSKQKLVIIVSHDREFAEVYADRIVELADGKVISDLKRNADNNFVNVEIDGANVTIGDVDNITERDVKKIIAALKENDGETIITKKKKKSVVVEQEAQEEVYQEEVEFIRSKLPTKNTVKIGASSLVSKPTKLIFTVILTMISFALFGVLSALMLYNAYYSVSEALLDGGYTNTLISKNYEYDEYVAEVHDSGAVYKEIVDPESITKKEAQALFSKEEISQLNSTDKGVEYAGVFSFAPSYKTRTYSISGLGLKPDYHLYYQSRNIQGFSDCGEDYLLRNGAVKLAGRYPENSKEIALSEYFINLLYDSSFYNFKSQPTDYNGILKELEYRREYLGSVRYDINIVSDNGIAISVNVVGVYGFSDLEPYQEIRGSVYKDLPITYRETQSANLKKIVEGFDSIGYVSDDFYARYSHFATDHLSTPSIVTISGVRYGELNKVEGSVASSSIQYAYTPNVCRDDMYRFTFYDCDGNVVEYQENKNQIYLSKKLFVEFRTELGSLQGLKESPFHVKNSAGEEYELQIVGYYENVGQVRTGIIFFSDEFVYEVGKIATFRRNNVDTKYQQVEGAMYEYVVTAVDGSLSQCKMILSPRDTYFFKMENEEYRRLYDGDIIETLNDLKVIFTVASVVIGVFSALMLFNFISSSISTKKKEIGILRALGAGGKDVLKIFLCETILLTAICFVFATIFAFIGSYLLNYALVYFFETKVLRFRFVNVLIMLAVAIFISFVGTFLPVLREAKKSPAEGIREI